MTKRQPMAMLAFARVNESDFDCALRIKEESDQLKLKIKILIDNNAHDLFAANSHQEHDDANDKFLKDLSDLIKE